MAITVNIIIRGIALCYKKTVDEVTKKELWRVFFPFDDENLVSPKGPCHKLNFTWKKDDGPNLPLDGVSAKIKSLAQSNGLITITASQEKLKTSGETDNFKDFIFDYTNHTAPKPITHQKVGLIKDWRNGTVVMKIEVPATFSVEEYLNNLTNEPVGINEDDDTGAAVAEKPVAIPIAHTIKAIIELDADKTLTVTDTSGKKLAVVPDNPLKPDGVYTLIFDNDCKDKRPKNDMDMFYEKTIVDLDANSNPRPKRRFIIGKRPKKGPAAESIPASLVEGKPCLAVKTSDSDNFPEV